MNYPWTMDVMHKINRLTPTVVGRSFDPDWFLLRQQFEQMEEKMFQQGIEWDGKQWSFNGKS
jgi:hypothetical protein